MAYRQQFLFLSADVPFPEFIERKVYDEMPVRVEYVLTRYSRMLFPMIKQMVYWGQGHRMVIKGK